MTTEAAPAPRTRTDLPTAEDVTALVREWLEQSAGAPQHVSAERLAGVLQDPTGLDFTLGFVDRVVRPEDLAVAARNLQQLAPLVPRFLPLHLRGAVRLGGAVAPLLPWAVIPIARRVLRGMVGHLVIDATPAKLTKSLAALRTHGTRLNMNLLGEAVLGDAEADRRLAGTRALLERDDVEYVSIKASSVAAQLSMWGFEQTVERVVARLLPLYEAAAAAPTPKFINLDMEEYKDLDFTIEVFTRVLDRPALRGLEAGIVIQAYLPDALAATQRLHAWAAERRASGGAPIKVRVVKGANLAMEHVDAAVHGWPIATWGSKQDSDTNYKRVLAWAMTPERLDAMRLGVAGHNLFDIAFAVLLAESRGIPLRGEQGRPGAIEFEMLLGMATGQADAVRRRVGHLLLYTPVVRPTEFDSAISYLVRRLEENASSENFMSAVFELDANERLFRREADRFAFSLATLETETPDAVPAPHRVQDRTAPIADHAGEPFDNAPDTDPAIAANRAWGAAILARVPGSRLGLDLVAASQLTDAAAVERVVADTVDAGIAWGARSGAERAAVLDAAGTELERTRGALIEVMAAETGKTIAEADPEVSEARDFAHYYAERARELDDVDGARFAPERLTVVTPPWNFPVAIPAGSVLAALAAGSGVIIKPAPQARRSAAVMVEALWAAGVPREVLRYVDVAEGELGAQLVAHPAVGRVILTGSWETAQLFRSWRHDLPLLAETSGKNAIVVTPSADLDLAAADVVKSAFGHAGQKCSAASLVILVGSVGRSERFVRQLVDAVRTLKVGFPADATTQMGPVVEPATGKLLRGLTELEPGQRWLVAPEPRDETGRLWSPGVRDGVAEGSEFHLTEYFGPVLGVMRAADLDEALRLQNAVAYGLTAGIHSLDPAEVSHWLDTVQAGNLYVNRGITGAIVRRQPFGGWKRSAVGAGTKAGGPNYVATLGAWRPIGSLAQADHTDVLPAVARLVDADLPETEHRVIERLHAGAASDQRAWQAEFGVARDVSQLGVERNVFRYLPVPVAVRLGAGGEVADLVRVLAAAVRAGAPVTLSTDRPLAPQLVAVLRDTVVTETTLEPDAAWLDRLGRTPQGRRPHRIRMIGGDATALGAAVEGDPDVAVYANPVTAAGRVELLPFLHEQAISITAHRFGNPDRAFADLPV